MSTKLWPQEKFILPRHFLFHRVFFFSPPPRQRIKSNFAADNMTNWTDMNFQEENTVRLSQFITCEWVVWMRKVLASSMSSGTVKPMTKRQQFEDKGKTKMKMIPQPLPPLVVVASNTYPVVLVLRCHSHSSSFHRRVGLLLRSSNVKNFSDISGVFECYWFLDGPTNANSRLPAVVLVPANRR